MTKVFSVLMVLSLGACSTMHFDNGSTSASPDMAEWHHDGIVRLVEFSAPVDMHSRCEGKNWSTIKVEKPFVHGLVTSITGGWYDPWSVEYACK